MSCFETSVKRVIKELDGAVLGVEIDIDKDQDIAKQALSLIHI